MQGWVIVIIVFVVIFALLLLPLYHWIRSVYEVKRYLNLKTLQKKHKDLKVVNGPRGRLVYRYTKAYSITDAKNNGSKEDSPLLDEDDDSSFSHKEKYEYTICLPGGLGSTLMNTSFIHAKLVQAGFDVLSYDRMGVGLSGWVKNNASSMQDTVNEMHQVMEEANPNSKGWIIIGGSYGSAVGQLYTSQHPEKVVGFINWDGLPYYLSHIPGARSSFGKVAVIYFFEALMSDLGFLRFPIFCMLTFLKFKDSYQKSGFSWEEVYAEFQDSKLLRTIQKETPLMMDCCDMLVEAWGDINFDNLPKKLYEELINAPPHLTISENKQSPNEPHIEVCSHEDKVEQERIRSVLHSYNTNSTIAQRWKQIPVVSLSCRNYDYDKREIFMTKANKDLYAAEHSFLVFLSKSGTRVVFPDKSHAGSVTLGDYLVKYAIEIADSISEDRY